MIRALLFAPFLCGLSPSALAGGIEPFPSVAYHHVKAFYFNAKDGRPECTMPLDEGKQLCSSVERPGSRLSKAQARQLLSILNQPGSYNSSFARCFVPHHAFVLYDRAGKPRAEVSICFRCSRLALSPGRPEARALSEQGVRQLRRLCTELGLKACDSG